MALGQTGFAEGSVRYLKHTFRGKSGSPSGTVKAIFFAEGPDIRAGAKLKSFDNIDVYPFVARLLQLEVPPIDGDIKPLQRALK